MEKKAGSRDGSVKKPYSPRALPTKNSSAISGVRRESPAASGRVQHAASCSWSRRGRLKELRSRCVARKFLYLWIQRTFGRIFPSQARFHYEQRILRKVFEEWKEEWWVSHREWKLRVRADCHYRYYLYNLMFQNWKTYVQRRQEMRSKCLRAEEHDAKRKMRQAWKFWLIYVVVHRTKLQMRTTALDFRQRSVLWMWWSQWRWRLGQARASRALYAVAMRHWALCLQLQAWSRWREQLLHSQKERQKAVSAARHHQCWQKRASLKAWLDYLHIRRVKREQKEMAERLHRATVLQMRFYDWQWAWARRQSVYARWALVEGLARRMTLRRAFAHWKHYVLLRAEAAAQRELAEDHRRHSLLHFCFRALKDNVTQAHLQQIRRNLAHQQHDARLLRSFWNLWQSRVEQREEREQLPLLRAAWGHHRVTLLRKCITLWLQYTQRRRYKQLLQVRADGHFQQRTLPAAFCTWRGLWRRHQQELVLTARAARFHRETVAKQVFSIWWQKMFQHRENRLAERMAILQAERQLLCRSWSTWQQRAVVHRQGRERQGVACAHHHHRRLRKAFCIWRECAQGLRAERMGRARAAAFHSARLLRWAWSRWRECMALRVAEQQKLVVADRHGQRTALRGALQKWLAYQAWVQSILQEVAARESQHDRQLLRWVLRRWRENAVARADEARKTSRASAHYRRTVCSKVLVQWRLVATVRVYYRQQEADALREAQRVLDRGCLRTWFQRWRDHSRTAALRRAQLERAAQHWSQRLLLEALARWKAHHLGCVRKRLLQRQGAQLLAQRLCRACFRQWQQQLVARWQEQRSTARALWFWSFSLQAKAWAVWLGFVLERRRKKARLEQAVQAYHRGLLQEGAVRLLRFTAGAKARRQQLQAQQQAQAARSLHRAVCRCAELWKQKVLGPGREPQPTAPIVPSRRVTFEVPLPDHVAAGAGDATLDTRRSRAPQPQGAPGSLALAAGEPHLPELATRSARKQPRCPHFLLESMQSQRAPGSGTLGQGSEKSREVPWPEQPPAEQAQAAGPSLPRPFLPRALPSAPGPKLLPAPDSSPELLLLPPSSFMSCGVGAPARVPAQPTTPGLKLQALPSLASGPGPHLLPPEDFTGTRAGPGLGSEAAGQEALEAELEGIQQQLQHYQTTKQNLRSCQRQASSLRRWLELSREEPHPEDQDEEQQVQKELEEVELQMQQLAEELRAQRQPVSACIARIQALRRVLC